MDRRHRVRVRARGSGDRGRGAGRAAHPGRGGRSVHVGRRRPPPARHRARPRLPGAGVRMRAARPRAVEGAAARGVRGGRARQLQHHVHPAGALRDPPRARGNARGADGGERGHRHDGRARDPGGAGDQRGAHRRDRTRRRRRRHDPVHGGGDAPGGPSAAVSGRGASARAGRRLVPPGRGRRLAGAAAGARGRAPAGRGREPVLPDRIAGRLLRAPGDRDPGGRELGRGDPRRGVRRGRPGGRHDRHRAREPSSAVAGVRRRSGGERGRARHGGVRGRPRRRARVDRRRREPPGRSSTSPRERCCNAP